MTADPAIFNMHLIVIRSVLYLNQSSSKAWSSLELCGNHALLGGCTSILQHKFRGVCSLHDTGMYERDWAVCALHNVDE